MNSSAEPRILVIQVAALGYDLVERFPDAFSTLPLTFHRLTPVFPAVTCTAQASLRTALAPEQHGMTSNGYFERQLRKAFFWEQSAAQVEGARIWDQFRASGGTVGTFCVQQSLGESLDVVLSPAPIHKHSGGLVQDCYTRPPGLYHDLIRRVGRSFNLFHYWGPFASFKSTKWITDATAALISDTQSAPDLLWTYLPHLDYGLQKYGPHEEKRLQKAVNQLVQCLQKLIAAAEHAGYSVLIWGDYSIEPASKPVRLNRVLREHGLFRTRNVKGMEYPDLYDTPAVAIADHQIAHIYRNDASVNLSDMQSMLENTDGVEQVWENSAQQHAHAGDLVAVAEPEAWFSYKWWYEDRHAPDYACHMDIHNKIGFDPCELFFGRLPNLVSMNDARVKGTHGRTDRPVAYGTTLDFNRSDIHTHLDLSRNLKSLLKT